MPFYLLFAGYAIVKHHLFDIKLILTEILVGTMGIILLILPFLMISDSLRILTSIIFFLFCVFGYYLIKAIHNEIKKKEEAEMFKVTSNELKTRLAQILDLEDVIFNISSTLIVAFKVKRISFAIKQPTSKFYEFHGTTNFQEKELASLVGDTFLCPYLEKTKKHLLREEIPSLIECTKEDYEKEELKTIQEKFKKNEICILFPLFQKEKLIGIIFFGPKFDGTCFKKEGIELLETISYQISLSIYNAFFYQEFKKDKDILEKFYRLIMGKELKISELQQKIKELEEKSEERE